MVFCFSGTGNSRYIAGKIAKALQDKVVDLNEKIKANDNSPMQAGRNVIERFGNSWVTNFIFITYKGEELCIKLLKNG